MIYDNAIRVIMSNIKKKIEILKKETMIDLSNFLFENRYNTYNFGLFKVRKVHTDSWVLVTDNGTTTRKYNNLLPYYMNTHAILGKDFVTYTLYRK